jgi:hypothetical protein
MATALVAVEVQNHATAATNDQNAQTVVDAQGNCLGRIASVEP